MIARIKQYLVSFNSFIQLLYGIRRRLNLFKFRLFRKRIELITYKYVRRNVENQSFLIKISELCEIPSTQKNKSLDIQSIIYSVEKCFSGSCNILGLSVSVNNLMDWHTDFKTGYRWKPGRFYADYKQEDIDNSSDVKIPRELSRCHHLLKCGLGYRLTNEEKYAEICVDHITDWIYKNPLMHSINWGCTMDVAIRAVNWIWTLAFISDYKELDYETVQRIKVSLYQHGWFIYRNPEKGYFNNHNHYLADLAGQIHLGLLFGDLKEPQEWLIAGKEELFREIRMQILPSGMSYERSTHYNRLVLELILIPILILERNGQEIPSDIWYRLERMFEFIMYSLKPDGSSPIIGDQDDGRLLPFGEKTTNNFKYLLSLGALLFERPDFKQHGEGFNIYCLILGGEGALEKWNQIPDIPGDLVSKAFPDAGLYIMRERNNYLLFNATGKGLYPELGSGTHTHSDLLSFELYTQDKSFLVDPGSYLYTADADQRMLFRETRMHNTITIDGKSQNNIFRENLWDFDRDAIPKVIKWESNNKLDLVTAVHNGYTRLQEPVLHQRTILFNKINEKWVIKDSIFGKGFHTCEWFFHFDVDIDFSIIGNIVETKCKDGKDIALNFGKPSGLTLRKERSFVSKSYGVKEDSFVLVAVLRETVPIELRIEIMKISVI